MMNLKNERLNVMERANLKSYLLGAVLAFFCLLPGIPAFAATDDPDEDKDRFEGIRIYELNEVDEAPRYKLGDKALMNDLKHELVYPKSARKAKKQGTVACSFIVDTNGKIYNLKVERGLTPEMDAEALYALKRLRKWRPAKIKDRPVVCRAIIGVPFRLKDHSVFKK